MSEITALAGAAVGEIFDTGIFDLAIFETQERRPVSTITAQVQRPAITTLYTATAGALFDTATYDRGPFAIRERRIPFTTLTGVQAGDVITAEIL